jgi:hypothetical protein
MAELRWELLRNGSRRLLVGIPSVGRVPVEDALSWFVARLAEQREEVDRLHVQVIARIRTLEPEIGSTWPWTAPRSGPGPTATGGGPSGRGRHKGHQEKGESGWWFGSKVHLAVDTGGGAGPGLPGHHRRGARGQAYSDQILCAEGRGRGH